MLYGISDSPMVGGLSELKMQAAATLLGLFGMLIISNIDYEVIVNKLWIPLLILELGLMGFTLVWGRAQGANRSWIFIFGVSIQPSEFVKLSYIVTFTKHLDLVRDKINNPLQLILLGLHAGAVIGLILLSGDLGVALVYVGFTLIMLFASGLSIFWFAGGGAAAIIAFPYVWPLLREDQQLRIIYGFNPEADPLGKGMQPLLGKKAIGNGGIFGQGLHGGSVYKNLYACENDFAFSSVCEKFGIACGMLVIVLLLIIVIRCFVIANTSRKRTGTLICIGVAGTIIVQSIENIGMCLAMLPVVGITLPFISYGGSSTLAMYLMIGMVHSVRSHRVKYFFERESR